MYFVCSLSKSKGSRGNWTNYSLILNVDTYHITCPYQRTHYHSIQNWNISLHPKLEKWFPLQGYRVHVVFLEFSKTNQRLEGTKKQQQTYQFTQGYNILHTLQVHHLTLTFIISNKYLSTLSESALALSI